MKRSEMIEKMVKIIETAPKNCSTYHLMDMVLGRIERLGMRPPALPYEGINYRY